MVGITDDGTFRPSVSVRSSRAVAFALVLMGFR